MPYACRNAGACCTAGWPIPIERDRLAILRGRALGPHTAVGDAGHAGRATILARLADGTCACYDAERRRCSIHAAAGPELLPAACENFPRVSRRDPRGTFVTLSHFCPTAASLLLSAGEIAIVRAPVSLSLDGRLEGLDASAVLPPLLRPGMLMDYDGYSAWERQVIATFDDRRLTAGNAVRIVRRATETAQAWTPGPASLAASIDAAFVRARRDGDGLGETDAPLQRPLKAFLAAHAFASWDAYGTGGLDAVVRAIDRALELTGDRFDDAQSFVDAVRRADLRLRHTSDRDGAAPPVGNPGGQVTTNA